MTARVFVVNEPRPPKRDHHNVFDLEPAKMFGDLEYVFRLDDNRPSSNTSWAVEHANSVLEQAESTDFIVWAGGDPMTMAIVSAVLLDLTDGKINYLAWNRSTSTYTPVPIDLGYDEIPFENGETT